MLLEETLESLELMRDAFDVIETIATDDKFRASEFLPEVLDALLRGIRFDSFQELVWIDADGKGSNVNSAAFEVDRIRSGRRLAVPCQLPGNQKRLGSITNSKRLQLEMK